MKREPVYKDDLDYLAELGFEQVATDASDLNDLKKRIHRRTFSFSNLYLMSGSLIVGVVIGFALFFGFSGDKKNVSEKINTSSLENPQTPDEGEPVKTITLDTINIVKENFIKPTAHKRLENAEKESTEQSESADKIISKPVDLSELAKGHLKEGKLKYIINAPVFYLHDMKITSYTTLYFEKNRFVRFSGLSAAYYASDEDNAKESNLKESADYYLHEEIASAMLKFKKGKYDEAIYTLKNVASYNAKDLNCDFYTAMCYYHKKNFTKAIPLFDECIFNANNTFLQEAMYYKALSLSENGNKEEAKKLFEKIVDEGEFYAIKAKAALSGL
ncbi:hypothetical protein CNR22_04935 [Sphingobacteriaceae bacterium]|nr:hypothetical protein CNR22_04935 [Sphingobacteriaceae bacterium]